MSARESRPAGAASETAGRLSEDHATAPEPLSAVDAAGVVDGVLVAVVRLDSGRYRRRVFLSLASAQRSVERARARGQAAEVVLAQLVSTGTAVTR